MTTTTYSNKTSILSELWINYKQDEEFLDFIEYNDMGLPLAYAIDHEIVKSTDLSQRFIEETFDLLLAALEVDDTGFETLDELLGL
jgi:hypothetical protein